MHSYGQNLNDLSDSKVNLIKERFLHFLLQIFWRDRKIRHFQQNIRYRIDDQYRFYLQ